MYSNCGTNTKAFLNVLPTCRAGVTVCGTLYGGETARGAGCRHGGVGGAFEAGGAAPSEARVGGAQLGVGDVDPWVRQRANSADHIGTRRRQQLMCSFSRRLPSRFK